MIQSGSVRVESLKNSHPPHFRWNQHVWLKDQYHAGASFVFNMPRFYNGCNSRIKGENAQSTGYLPLEVVSFLTHLKLYDDVHNLRTPLNNHLHMCINSSWQCKVMNDLLSSSCILSPPAQGVDKMRVFSQHCLQYLWEWESQQQYSGGFRMEVMRTEQLAIKLPRCS